MEVRQKNVLGLDSLTGYTVNDMSFSICHDEFTDTYSLVVQGLNTEPLYISKEEYDFLVKITQADKD